MKYGIFGLGLHRVYKFQDNVIDPMNVFIRILTFLLNVNSKSEEQ